MYACVYRVGGLGNQLFQYAAARAVAEAKGYLLLVEKVAANTHNLHGHDYAALLMRDAEEVASIYERLPEEGSVVHHFEHTEGGGFAPWSVDDFDAVTGPIRLTGYFQYLPAIEGALPDFHFLQDEAYYERAISLLREKTPVDRVHVLSDNIPWCTTRKWTFDIVPVDEPDELACLALMSLCRRGAVIGNSTFSWWGAVLGSAPHVYYPSRWINLTIHDLFPRHWTKV